MLLTLLGFGEEGDDEQQQQNGDDDSEQRDRWRQQRHGQLVHVVVRNRRICHKTTATCTAYYQYVLLMHSKITLYMYKYYKCTYLVETIG